MPEQRQFNERGAFHAHQPRQPNLVWPPLIRCASSTTTIHNGKMPMWIPVKSEVPPGWTPKNVNRCTARLMTSPHAA